MSLFAGLKVIVSEHAETATWVYPVERFWEYIPSPETERWCRYFGYGHEKREPGAFQIGDMLYVHPKVYDELKRQIRQREQALPLCVQSHLVAFGSAV